LIKLEIAFYLVCPPQFVSLSPFRKLYFHQVDSSGPCLSVTSEANYEGARCEIWSEINRREAYDNRHYVRPALRMTSPFDGGRVA